MRFLKFLRETPVERHIYAIFIAVLFSVPLAGFLCGVYICEDCSFNPFSYFMMGVVHSVITTLAHGQCWTEHSSAVTVLPYVPVTTLLGYFLQMLLRYSLRRFRANNR